MPGRTTSPLGVAALNRALLARQLLLERAASPLPRALERMGGLQAQYAPSMYVGLWSRVRDLERGAVTRALERRTIVQGTLMRSTIHLVSRADYWPMALAVREARRASWHRAMRDVPQARMHLAAERLRDALAEGPVTRKQAEALLGKDEIRGIHLYVDLVRMPPAGTWERRRADLWEDAERWLGPPPDGLTAQDGVELLVRRYLGAFGPAPRRDIADWSGLPVREVAATLETLELRHSEGEDGAELLDLPRAPLPDPGTPAPVRFLPTWDATLLAHARRTQILPEAHRPRIFTPRNPQSSPVFLVDGAVAGTWRFEDDAVTVDPFEPLDCAAAEQVAAEAERLAAFHR